MVSEFFRTFEPGGFGERSLGERPSNQRCRPNYRADLQRESCPDSRERQFMSPRRLVISTTYKTRVALEKPCKER